jgi:hypothetical protein
LTIPVFQRPSIHSTPSPAAFSKENDIVEEAVNPYRAPVSSIVEPVFVEPRPFLMFVAAAICFGAGVLFLLLTIGAVLHFVRTCLDQGWQWFMTNKFGPTMLVFDLLSLYYLVTFMPAGRSFFVRKGRRGRRFLLAAVVGVGLFVVLLQFDHL